MHRFLLPFEQDQITFPDGDMLVIRPDSPLGLNELPQSGLVLEQGFKPIHAALENAGFNAVPQADGRFAMTLVNLTRSKVENLGNIARASRITDGIVLVNGAKTDGIESVLKQLRKRFPVSGVLSKAHGKVLWFEAQGPLADWEDAAKPAKNPAEFITAAGMFSPDKIDKGSSLLAPHLRNLSGRVADLGAGWGWLAHGTLATNPNIEVLDLLEADFQALEAAKENISDDRAAFHWVDIRSMRSPASKYNAIICNPPFHQSRAAEPQLGVDFIRQAAAFLTPKGQFLMVANRHLPYERSLNDAFRKVQVIGEAGGFKLFSAKGPLA